MKLKSLHKKGNYKQGKKTILKMGENNSKFKCLSTRWETWVQFLGHEVPWRKKWQPTPVLFPRKSHGLVSIGSQRVGRD